VEGGYKLYRAGVTNQSQGGEEGVWALDGPVGTVTVVDRAICSKTGRRKYNRAIFGFPGRGKPTDDLGMGSAFLYFFRM
jgi:hypothetical protein